MEAIEPWSTRLPWSTRQRLPSSRQRLRLSSSLPSSSLPSSSSPSLLSSLISPSPRFVSLLAGGPSAHLRRLRGRNRGRASRTLHHPLYTRTLRSTPGLQFSASPARRVPRGLAAAQLGVSPLLRLSSPPLLSLHLPGGGSIGRRRRARAAPYRARGRAARYASGEMLWRPR